MWDFMKLGFYKISCELQKNEKWHFYNKSVEFWKKSITVVTESVKLV